MVDFDVNADITPTLSSRKPNTPTIAAMKAALTTFSSTTFTAARLNAMSKNDLIYACRQNSLSVVGL